MTTQTEAGEGAGKPSYTLLDATGWKVFGVMLGISLLVVASYAAAQVMRMLRVARQADRPRGGDDAESCSQAVNKGDEQGDHQPYQAGGSQPGEPESEGFDEEVERFMKDFLMYEVR